MSDNEFSQLIITAFESMLEKYEDKAKIKIEFHPNIKQKDLETAKEKIAPGLEETEIPLVLIDLSRLAGLFSSKGSMGLILTSRGLYENVSWFEHRDYVPLNFPWESLNSIELHCPYMELPRILLNGIPLFGIFETFKECDEEFLECLYKVLVKILASRPKKEKLSLQEIARFYSISGLLKPTKFSKPEINVEGLAKADRCFSEFNKDEDVVLFHLYEKKSFWSNEVHMLITNKGIFAYADYVDENNYQYWNLDEIDDIRVEHSYAARRNTSGLYINKTFVYGTADQDYSRKRIVRFFCMHNNYAIAALICEIVNSVRKERTLFPWVLTNVDIGSEYRTNRGPLKSLQQNSNRDKTLGVGPS